MLHQTCPASLLSLINLIRRVGPIPHSNPHVSFATLPNELLDAVCRHLLTHDLVSLALAERLLYRDLVVSPASPSLSVIITLSSRPALAINVQSLTINLGSIPELQPSFYDQLSVVLQAVVNITGLSLFLPEGTSWVLGLDPGASYPNLTRFFSSFPLDSHVKSFLKRTPCLSTLALGKFGPSEQCTVTLPSTCAPLLKDFTGPSEAAATIIPGRPVEFVHLTTTPPTAEAVVGFVTLSTANILSFGAHIASHPITLIQPLCQHIPWVTYLSITTSCSFSELPSHSFYEDIAAALSRFPSLQLFELSGMVWGYDTQKDGRVWQSAPLDVEPSPEVDEEDAYLYSYY
ncbi:hypothetical protein CPB85DRAFT_1283418 [Mucidula mucida]|nr:hypothetical protein CPB85DRAFT_1283418 [Mucidula mucida]